MPYHTQAWATLCIAGLTLMIGLARTPRIPEKHAAHQGVVVNTFRIDPNTADAQTLCLLPRIGPGIAQRLVDDREAHGPFQEVDELARVPMIGRKTVRALKPWVVFTPSSR